MKCAECGRTSYFLTLHPDKDGYRWYCTQCGFEPEVTDKELILKAIDECDRRNNL